MSERYGPLWWAALGAPGVPPGPVVGPSPRKAEADIVLSNIQFTRHTRHTFIKYNMDPRMPRWGPPVTTFVAHRNDSIPRPMPGAVALRTRADLP